MKYILIALSLLFAAPAFAKGRLYTCTSQLSWIVDGKTQGEKVRVQAGTLEGGSLGMIIFKHSLGPVPQELAVQIAQGYVIDSNENMEEALYMRGEEALWVDHSTFRSLNSGLPRKFQMDLTPWSIQGGTYNARMTCKRK